jgi:N-terminal domain of anti-restriction factor ArdC
MASPIVNHSSIPVVTPPFQTVVTQSKPHASVYDIVTERILAELEKGQVPWRKPWRTLPPAT